MATPAMADNWEDFPNGLRVMVVDDDPLCLKVVEQMLRRCSYSGEATGEQPDMDVSTAICLVPILPGPLKSSRQMLFCLSLLLVLLSGQAALATFVCMGAACNLAVGSCKWSVVAMLAPRKLAA